MKYPPRAAGLFQAAALTAYVSAFAIIAQAMQRWLAGAHSIPDPVASIILFLLAFLVSALICGAIALRYPLILFFAEKKHDALKVVVWTAGWLALFFAVFLIEFLLLV